MDTASFELPGDERGVLCVHGFTGTPHDMRFIGESLAARGMTVRAIALPGHATRVEDLERRNWPEWTAAVTAAFDDLASRCARVAVVGQSLGGLLSLQLAATRPVHAVASLAAPLWFDGLGKWVTRAISAGYWPKHVRFLPKIGGSDIRYPPERRNNPSYSTMPVYALGQVVEVMNFVDGLLPNVVAPLLIVHSEQDHTAPVGSAQRIAQRVASRVVKTRILTESYHVLSVDIERTIVADEVGAFLAQHLAS